MSWECKNSVSSCMKKRQRSRSSQRNDLGRCPFRSGLSSEHFMELFRVINDSDFIVRPCKSAALAGRPERDAGKTAIDFCMLTSCCNQKRRQVIQLTSTEMPAADRSSILIAAAFSFHFSSAANYRNGNEQDRLAKSAKQAYDERYKKVKLMRM